MIDQNYQGLITSEYKNSTNFLKMISFVTSVYVQIQNLYTAMIPAFDVDLATGSQLDTIGLWVGISRNVSIPITGVYFSFDGAYTTGWDYGSWQPSATPVNITTLPDDAYRNLLRAKIAANNWDGTTDGAYAIWDAVFTQFTILIQDNQDMSYNLGVVGGIIDSLTLALITGGYIPLRPEGVRVNQYFVSADSNPVFSWDVSSPLLAGWDTGSWVREIMPT